MHRNLDAQKENLESGPQGISFSVCIKMFPLNFALTKKTSPSHRGPPATEFLLNNRVFISRLSCFCAVAVGLVFSTILKTRKAIEVRTKITVCLVEL